MRMVAGDVNVYYIHDELTPDNVRAASYGTDSSSGALVPQIGDVIEGFHGWDAEYQSYEALTVEVVHVLEIETGGLHKAFEVHVKTVR